MRHLDAMDNRDISRVRAARESLAARTLVPRPDREDAVAALRHAVDEMDRWAHPIARTALGQPALPPDAVSPVGNETLLHSWTSLEGSIWMSIMLAGVDRALKNMDAKRHLAIVDAIEAGDADTAAATVREHMAGAASVLVDA